MLTACCTWAVTPGDPRDGYEHADYETASRQLSALRGSALALAELAGNPPLGLPPLPAERLPVAAAIDLGRRLFFDRRLSANATLSCAMCHVPEQGFTQNELKTPVGIEGRFVHRNAPSLYNVAYQEALFHDGREDDLANQIWAPLLAANEMGNASREAVVERLGGLEEYEGEFLRVFGDGISAATLGRALASYQTALLSADSPFDRWYFGGEADAVGAEVKRGFRSFVNEGCATCHQLQTGHATFTDGAYHDTGIGFLAAASAGTPARRLQIAPGVIIDVETDIATPHVEDDGRAAVTGDPADRWRYRTPGLRNVALSAPYMHDGSLATVEAVIDYYAAGGAPHDGQDARIRPLSLGADERADLVAFLQALTGSNVDALAGDARAAPIGDTHHGP